MKNVAQNSLPNAREERRQKRGGPTTVRICTRPDLAVISERTDSLPSNVNDETGFLYHANSNDNASSLVAYVSRVGMDDDSDQRDVNNYLISVSLVTSDGEPKAASSEIMSDGYKLCMEEDNALVEMAHSFGRKMRALLVEYFKPSPQLQEDDNESHLNIAERMLALGFSDNVLDVLEEQKFAQELVAKVLQLLASEKSIPGLGLEIVKEVIKVDYAARADILRELPQIVGATSVPVGSPAPSLGAPSVLSPSLVSGVPNNHRMQQGVVVEVNGRLNGRNSNTTYISQTILGAQMGNQTPPGGVTTLLEAAETLFGMGDPIIHTEATSHFQTKEKFLNVAGHWTNLYKFNPIVMERILVIDGTILTKVAASMSNWESGVAPKGNVRGNRRPTSAVKNSGREILEAQLTNSVTLTYFERVAMFVCLLYGLSNSSGNANNNLTTALPTGSGSEAGSKWTL